MFQFSAFALHPYAFRVKYPCGWVAPFGNPRITARLPAPRGLSQVPASFIASRHQDIHHVPLSLGHTNRTPRPSSRIPVSSPCRPQGGARRRAHLSLRGDYGCHGSTDFALRAAFNFQLAACFPQPGRPKPGTLPLPRGNDSPPGKKPSWGSCSSVSGFQRTSPLGRPSRPRTPPGLVAREVGGKFRPRPFSVKPASDPFGLWLTKS
jgi:hypothetical protein